MGVVEKIKEIEEEMARTQKNKATEYHLGLLKAKLARYRAQLLEPAAKSGGGGTGFDVQKSGDARVALIGFPSVGKSTLLSKVTHTASETAAYEFTTLTAIPGVIEYQGARIQLLDLPGIVEGASQGRGRGRQVVSTAKTADLIVIMLDATKSEEQRRLLEIELDSVGIRLNKRRPDVVFKRRTTGGITFTATVKLTKTDERTIRLILQSYKLHNCDVMIREDITTDEFIDVLIGTRKYIPCLYVCNKIDAISLERMDQLAHDDHTVVISCEMDLNLNYLIDRIWDDLGLVKVYTKKRGAHPDLADPICMRRGSTIEDGKSSKFSPHAQKVGLNHLVQDEDVVSRPDDRPCRTCLSTLTPEGKKNIRRNTSAALRINGKDGKQRTIVIDVGKNFQAAALEWFPKYGLRRIDAVLITHAHADAMNGLDDLRAWTLNGVIQPHIDVYVSKATFTEVQRSFPYMVAKEFASGGGDVPEFKWHIIEDKVPFEIEGTGIEITPFAVHHGRLFSVAPPPGFVPTPVATMPSTPTTTSGASSPTRRSPDQNATLLPKIHPYICFGFKINDVAVYLSDVSHIPDDSWALLEEPLVNGQSDSAIRHPYAVVVLDCLRLHPHTSHLGIKDATNIARRLGAQRTYLTGFGHEVSHDEYVTIGEVVGGKEVQNANMSSVERRGISLLDKGKSIWLRPAHDGLQVVVADNRKVKDSTYEF